MILEQYLFKNIIMICKKMFDFCWKPSKVLILFIFCIFGLIEE